MRLHWRSEGGVGRADLEDYVRPFVVDVKSFDDDFAAEHLVGRIAVAQILWADAEADGESLFRICDNDSGGLHELHTILTDGTDRIRDDLGVELPVESVAFVHGVLLHPSVQTYRVAILDAAFRLFGPHALAVMWMTAGDTPVRERAQLGLARVAGSDLVFRHNAVTTPYSKAHPLGRDISFTATAAMEQWVLDEWRQRFEPIDSADVG